RGLVAIEANPADRRSRLLRLRPAGLKALTRALPVWQALHGEIDGTLAHAEAQRLRDDLRTLTSDTRVSPPASAPRR
ncbi:MarR family transcriptional regulator, partial [Ralstonia pseudosolanacearum]